MKRIALLVILAVFFIALPDVSFARHGDKEKKDAGKSGIHKEGYMKCMMKEKMMDKEMVAAGDGGVIVLMGNRLLKYDAELNLVKEVEIDIEGMIKRMKERMDMMKEAGPEEASE